MTRTPDDSKRPPLVVVGSDRPQSPTERLTETVYGISTPRIHSKLLDLPTRGQEVIDFADSIGIKMLDWQKWVTIEAGKYKEDNRPAHPLVCVVVARQNGKTTLMKAQILAGLFMYKKKLQIGTAHRLTTSLETFRDLVNIIEENDALAKQVKRIRWAHGSEEIETLDGCRYMVKAGASAARGISKPELVHIDETRELKDESTWASLRYTMMAAEAPQLWTYSNAGDQHSVILNQLRERGMVAAAGGADDILYAEWSSHTDDIANVEGWRQSNPSLGHTIHIDNLKAVLNDPPDVVRTEVLCRWVATISSAIPSQEWNECSDETIDLDPEKQTWMAIDCAPDRRAAALVAAQKIGDDKFFVKLLHTWQNPINLDDLAVANDIAPYTRMYPTECVAYSKRTSSAVAARLQPAGIRIVAIDGSEYSQSCDELLGSVTSKRFVHRNQAELSKQILSATRLNYGDGGWVIGRRASQATVCAAVGAALVTHFATRPETDLDIMVG
jgi:hypothetical protein